MAKNFIIEDLGLFWSFQRLYCIFFLILEDLRAFLSFFIYFGSILIIILQVFGHLSSFHGIFAHSICIWFILEVQGVYWSFYKLRGIFSHFRDFWVFWLYFISFEGIMVIQMVLGVFWSFRGFRLFFVILEVSWDICPQDQASIF